MKRALARLQACTNKCAPNARFAVDDKLSTLRICTCQPCAVPARRGQSCLPAPNDGHAIPDRQHDLLQLGVVAYPLVELLDRVPEVAASGLCVEVWVHVGVAIVKHIVTDDDAGWGEEVELQDKLDVAAVLGLVGIHKDKVELAGELGQGVQGRSDHDLMAVRDLREAGEAISKPAFQVGVDLQRDDSCVCCALEHGYGAVPHEHTDLEYTARRGHEGELLQEHCLEGVRGHLLAV
mmetsp:Transcript_8341/g.23163  ORF Transcript_8341/g.23163 Transcript_8341/m.23163 type:complete len:236 (-) Transcript_8341:191-898(-)